MTVRLGHEMAPWEGIEPPTNWLTANCSTAELPRNMSELCMNFGEGNK